MPPIPCKPLLLYSYFSRIITIGGILAHHVAHSMLVYIELQRCYRSRGKQKHPCIIAFNSFEKKLPDKALEFLTISFLSQTTQRIWSDKTREEDREHLPYEVIYLTQAVDGQAGQCCNLQEGQMLTWSNYLLSFSSSGIPAYFNGHQTTTSSLMTEQFQGMLLTQHSFMPIWGLCQHLNTRCVPSVPEKPAGAQLTIFNAGSVNVHDDVPAEKAQAIMFLVDNGSSYSGKTAAPQLSTVGHIKQATCMGLSPLNALPATNPQANFPKSQTTVQSQTS